MFGFHIRYLCGVLEQHNIDYRYMTIRSVARICLSKRRGRRSLMNSLDGFACMRCCSREIS